MYTIRKEFSFSASHVLEGLPDSHPCSRLHGHNYTITIELRSGALNSVGFVVDYRELDDVKKFIDTVFDHKHLNDFMQINPSAENIARMIYMKVKAWHPEIHAVTVSETPKTSATYSTSL